MSTLRNGVCGINMERYLACLVLFLQFYTGNLVTMITQSQRYVINEGESLALVCDFHADHYNLFDYPVLWKKTQHEEECRINIMGNINDPFVATGRFEVSYSANPPRYRLDLMISDVCAEDSGNYTCEVRGPNSLPLDTMTHYVFVRAAVEDLYFVHGNVRADQPTVGERSLRTVTVVENVGTTLGCIAQGGYPAPHLQVKIGRQDISDEFKVNIRPMLKGQKGFRTILYTTERWSSTFNPTADLDGKKLKCSSVVAGLRPNITFVRLNVQYSPKITCFQGVSFIGAKNVYVMCHVRAKPRVTSIYWLLDATNTTLSDGEVRHEFWTLRKDLIDGILEYQLYMHKATKSHFRIYTLVAENSIGVSSGDVQLSTRSLTTTANPAHHPDANVLGKDLQGSSHAGYKHVASSGSHVTCTLLMAISFTAILHASKHGVCSPAIR